MKFELGRFSLFGETHKGFSTCPICEQPNKGLGKVRLTFAKYWWGRGINLDRVWFCHKCDCDTITSKIGVSWKNREGKIWYDTYIKKILDKKEDAK